MAATPPANQNRRVMPGLWTPVMALEGAVKIPVPERSVW